MTDKTSAAPLYIEDLLTRKEECFFPSVLHMGKLLPVDLEQCICLNRMYFAARYDPEAARCLKSNGLPLPTPKTRPKPGVSARVHGSKR
jgi:diadenosine tetraphosphatase ApaH/serine/threonine PP2A family protein phosphatase